MLMGITRIGNLIINENGFNLLLVFCGGETTPSAGCLVGSAMRSGPDEGRHGNLSGRGGESVKRCVIFKTTFYKI